MIDPTVNLAAEPRTLRHARWILPFKEQNPFTVAKTDPSVGDGAAQSPTTTPTSPAEMARLQQEAEGGDSAAQLQLAELLRTGQAGVTNLEQAFAWSMKAAESGLPDAQYQTALCHLHGHGTHTNLVQAMKWATLAGRQSHRKAMDLQDELRLRLTPLQMALARRLVSDVAGKPNGAEDPSQPPKAP